MTRRGRAILALGALTYLAAWAFGSKPLYPVAVGLAAAVLLASILLRAAAVPSAIRRRVLGARPLEGDDVGVEVELALEPGLPAGPLTLVEEVRGLGARETHLRRRDGATKAAYVLPRVPRGRYSFERIVAVREDPFGLGRRETHLADGGALLVFPRLVELRGLFSEVGAHAQDGRRLLLRRPTGYDLHSVREYEEGESLRKVHWPTTARRGTLMVKELEDAPRDEFAVVLDCTGPVVGEPPDSSFDLQVRAAGSLLRAHVRRGRRSLLLLDSPRREVQRVESETAWQAALELLATVQPGPASEQRGGVIADEGGEAARALDLTVVTAALSPRLVERLVRRARERRSVSLVYVDAASFAAHRRGGGPDARGVAPLSRLRAAGVPVAVIGRGANLAAALGAPASTGAAIG